MFVYKKKDWKDARGMFSSMTIHISQICPLLTWMPHTPKKEKCSKDEYKSYTK